MCEKAIEAQIARFIDSTFIEDNAPENVPLIYDIVE